MELTTINKFLNSNLTELKTLFKNEFLMLIIKNDIMVAYKTTDFLEAQVHDKLPGKPLFYIKIKDLSKIDKENTLVTDVRNNLYLITTKNIQSEHELDY